MQPSRFFLEVSYLGTRYHGWQVQHNAASIQERLQAALTQCLRRSTVIMGSSRTDTGVHASQQFAHVDIPGTVDTIRLCHQVNALLPRDIVVVAIHPVVPHAHARFDALSRTYRYTVVRTRNPFLHETSYLFPRALDIDQMNQAATLMRGERDFQGFCKAHTSVAHYLCTVTEAHWTHTPEQLTFCIKANRFLRGMVRFIVSHLLQVGTGKMQIEDLETLLQQKKRSTSAASVPACGLTLTAVSYPDKIFLSPSVPIS